jgi:hypothetical protein
MSWLRSRWTVVALVPAFFLLGFGLVSALAGGSESSEPGAAAPGSSRDGSAGPEVVTVYEETLPTGTEADAGNDEPATEDEGNGNGGGAAPPVPASGTVTVDYGRWDGAFELANPAIVPGPAAASIVGELRYSGGVDCQVGLVRVRFWLYDGGGREVGRGVWASTDSTGEGSEITGREPLPFEADAQVSAGPGSAALRFTAVECL